MAEKQTSELYAPGSKFPVEVKPKVHGTKLMTAAEVAATTQSSGGFRFSMDSREIVEFLRILADRIESSGIIPQQAQTIQDVRLDDYPMTVFNFVYYDKDINKKET